MKHRPVHENLDTSFVNLAALVRYLRGRDFVGTIHVELSGYEADIFFSRDRQLRAREYDRVAGRIAEGEEALQRILIRSRQPGGTVSVYQEIADNETLEKAENKPPAEPAKEDAAKPAPIQNIKPVSVQIPKPNGKPKTEPTIIIADDNTPKPEISLPAETADAPLPLEFSNRVEEKARQTAALSPEEWQTLVGLLSELLDTCDKSLAAANLNFAAAFQKACAEASADYPFLNPAAGTFQYQRGAITMRAPVSARIFTAAITDALRRILEKLGSNPKFHIVYRHTTQRILAHLHQQKPLYDKFSVTSQMEKVLKV